MLFRDTHAEPWLGAVHAGLKRHELRLDTHPATKGLGVGDHFLAASPRRELEVRIISLHTYDDFGAAWLAHGDSLIPPAVRDVRSAVDAHEALQSFYKTCTTSGPGKCRVFGVEVVRTVRGTPPDFARRPAAQPARAPKRGAAGRASDEAHAPAATVPRVDSSPPMLPTPAPIEVARANYAMLRERTLPPRVA